MKLSATYNIPAPRERVFDALTDPAMLCRCIEGCEMFSVQEDGTYHARLCVGIGSIKGNFTGIARMTDVNPPETYTLNVDGRGGPGFVIGSARMRLAPEGEATTLSCDADVNVGGMIAAVGSRLVAVAAKRMMDRFFEALAREMAAC